MTACPSEEILGAFYNGLIEDDDQIEAVGDHVEMCQACARKLSSYSPSRYEEAFRDVITNQDGLTSNEQKFLDQQLAQADETSALIAKNVEAPQGVGSNKKERFSNLQPQKRGHFLRCVKAYDQLLQQVVAIKIPREGFVTSEEHQEQFRMDCCSYQVLSHPNILPVLDFGLWDDTRCFFCTPWIDSVPLNRWIESENVDFAKALRAIARICSAVQHAHENFVVHRHLDYRNVRVTEEGQVWISDFGFVFDQRYQFELFQNHKLLSPLLPGEFLEPDRNVDERSDVYSIGKMLAHCFTCATENDRPIVQLLAPIVSRSTAQSRSVRFQKVEDLAAAVASVDPMLKYFVSSPEV